MALWALTLEGTLLVAEDQCTILDEGIFFCYVTGILETQEVVPRSPGHKVPCVRISQTVGALFNWRGVIKCYSHIWILSLYTI